MKAMEFTLRGEHVALCDLLKLAGIASSGGQGKMMIANGEVTVDGQPEGAVPRAADFGCGGVGD